QVASEMRDRGFTILDVANDPLEESVEESAEIRLHPEMEAAAGLVAAMVPGSVLVRDERSSESVDLVIGEDFEGLDDMPEPDATADSCA
ncbi:LytR C-terminal domain-containing protein, partial [Phytoactinopolyspora endophytica]|uniref:LytR C-terminal domain-containing protein n=1 Tax=Phytoactinopolyspora endophytica TaxID=1642495 RepID=UPI0013EB9DBC